VTAQYFSIILVTYLGASIFTIAQNSAPPAQSAQIAKDQAATKASHADPVAVAGNWQMSWTGRLGVEQCVLHLQQDGTKLSGTFQDLRGISQLSGTADNKKIMFEVQFRGSHPFTTRFTGTMNSEKIEGTSEAVGVQAYLGHPGEIVHPEHPWTATRIIIQPNQSAATNSSSQTPAKN
jgi:hypothetical protein